MYAVKDWSLYGRMGHSLSCYALAGYPMERTQFRLELGLTVNIVHV